MAASPVKAVTNVTPGTPDVPSIPSDISARCTLLDPNDLAQYLKEKKEDFVILDCRPTLAYNSRRIIGALGINLNPMMTKRLKAGVCVCARVCVCVCVCVCVWCAGEACLCLYMQYGEEGV